MRFKLGGKKVKSFQKVFLRPLFFSFCYLSFVYGADKYHGVILIPEGLVESIPELYALLQVQIIYFFWKFMLSFISALEAVLLSVFFFTLFSH